MVIPCYVLASMVTGLDHFRCLTGCLEELISMKNGNQEVSGDIV